MARWASFSADGSHLYVSGWEGQYDVIDNTQVMNGAGLDIVDLKDGTIEAHLLDGVSVYEVIETPNAGIYVSGYDYRDGDFTKTLIAHIDSRAHDVMAQRSFENFIAFVIAPNPEN